MTLIRIRPGQTMQARLRKSRRSLWKSILRPQDQPASRGSVAGEGIQRNCVPARGEPFGELIAIVGAAGISRLPAGVHGPQDRGAVIQLGNEPIIGTHGGQVGGVETSVADRNAGAADGLTAPVQKRPQVAQVGEAMGQHHRVDPTPGPAGYIRAQLVP